MLPIELISHLARPLSPTLRLFGTIAGEDLVLLIVLLIVLLLVPLIVPLPILILMIFTSIVQTLVFMLLAMMFISGAMEEAH